MAVLAAFILWPRHPREVQPILPADLCREAFAGRLGYDARVPFPLDLTATSDPRIWEYRPGLPSSAFAPTIRLYFAEPVGVMPIPAVIIGHVERIEPDDLPRRSRHLGTVILTSCRLELPDQP